VKRKTVALALLLLLSVSGASAQTKYADRCTVKSIEMTGVKVSDLQNNPTTKFKPTELGTFDTVVSEEELTSKAFRLPGTNLFVVASVWYTDESLAGKDSQDSASLGLTISRNPKRDILSALQYAEAEMLMENFEVARVTTIFKTQKRSFHIEMECRKIPGLES
jgi:hypothetical protein